MASQMVVPASKDTLFMRGFSARREIDTIRDFFGREGGRCTVEFFKVSDDKSKLYVALKFDGKEIAKDLLNKYDNTDVLGDRITISWFKDLRRARMKAGGGRRHHWSPDRSDRYDYKDRYHNSGNRYMQSRWNRFGTRGRKFDRSSSRSRSRSSSRSRSRSVSPSRRSRSRSRDSHGGKRKRSRTTSDSRNDERSRRSRDYDRGSRRDRSSRDRSESIGRHSREDSVSKDEEEVVQETRKVERHSRDKSPQKATPKVIRSTVTTVERNLREEPYSDDDASDDGAEDYGRQLLSEDEDKHGESNHSYKEEQRVTTSEKANHRERPIKEVTDNRNHSFKEEKLEVESPDNSKVGFDTAARDRDRGFKDPEPVKEKAAIEDRFFPNRRREVSPPQLQQQERNQSGRYGNVYEKEFPEQEYHRNRMRRSLSPNERHEEPLPPMREKERMLPPSGDFPDSPPHLHERDTGYGYHGNRDSRSDLRYDDTQRDHRESPPPPPLSRVRTIPPVDPRDMRSPPLRDQNHSPDVRMRGKRQYEEEINMPMYERKMMREREFDDPRAPPPPPVRREPADELMDQKRRRYLDDVPVTRGEMREQHYDDRQRKERGPQGLPPGGRMHMQAERENERSPYFDDRPGTVPASSRVGLGPSFNGGMNREVEKGALGLPQDKMSLVKEKKEEIEKSYRQDCETFAAVTKMLISKDNVLEDKLQSSLRENLKDIGQRCIHELREFIETLKTDLPAMH